MMRFVRGLASLALLVALLAGVPWLLLRVGRLSELARLWRDFPEVLFTPDNGAVLLGALTVLGWLAWGSFTLGVLGELLGVVTRQRIRFTVPGLGRPQALASMLLISVAAMVATPVVAQAQPPPAHTPVLPGAEQIGRPAAAAGPTQPEAEQWRRHTVQRGESLWLIAEQHYGDGRQWSRILAGNADLIENPDEIEPGWSLALPGLPIPDTGPSGSQRPAPVVASGPAVSSVPAPGAMGCAEGGCAEGGRGEAGLIESNQPAPGRENDTTPDQSPPDQAPSTRGPAVGWAPAPAVAPAEAIEAAGAGAVSRAADTPSTSGDRAAAAASPADRIAVGVAGISSLTAAALLGMVALRRRTQLSQRPLGRQLLPLTPPLRHFEGALGQAQDPLSLAILDLALRALGRHYRCSGEPLPGLGAVLVADDRISLTVDRIPTTLPIGFHADATHLWLDPDGGVALSRQEGLIDEPAPYPSLVCLGETLDGTLLLHDLETIGLLGVSGDPDTVAGAFGSLLLELGCSWWGAGQSITIVGGDAELAEAIDQVEVWVADELGPVLDGIEASRRPANPTHPRDLRCRSELAEAWRPHVLLINGPVTEAELHRLKGLVEGRRVVAVLADDSLPGIELVAPPALSSLPNGIDFIAQRLMRSTRDNLVGLLRRTASAESRPAPWWDGGGDSTPVTRDPLSTASADEPEQFTNVTPLGPRRADRQIKEPAAMDAHEPTPHPSSSAGSAAGPPVVLLLGPIELVGAVGGTPNRAQRQCIEYCAWLLENPNATSAMMTNALFVAETTRRSNMSRLRSWLGQDPTGEPYLPDAYSGRISLHSAVSSDWQRLQLLTISGVDRAGDGHLVQALELVRGAPLADAAPGQWHWAEELRTDISSMVRDIGLVLGGRALERGDLDLARWAANRALIAAPEDERLLCVRVRTEHRANNVNEVERLALRLVRHARRLNVDLDEETVELLQQVMEGRPRGRVLPA